MTPQRQPAALLASAFLLSALAPELSAQKQLGMVEGSELARELDAAVATPGAPYWGSVLFVQKGKVVFAKGYGLQDHQRVPMGPRSLFDIGGLGRWLTLAAAVQLQAQAKWSLEDGLGRVMGDVPKDKAKITLRQLARQTSGLPAEVALGGGVADARRTAVDAMLAAVLVDAPGRALHASPRNDNLLAAAIELASGETYETTVQKRVLTPFGLRDTGFPRDTKLDDKRMTWRRAAGEAKPKPASDGGFDWAARGAMSVLSSAYDLQVLVQSLWNDKAFTKEQDLFFAPFAGGDLYRVRPIESGGVAFVEVHGAASGYRTRLLVHRASQSVLVLCSGEVDLDPVEARLCTILARAIAAAPDAATSPSASPKPQSPSSPSAPSTGRAVATDLDRFVGVFALPAGGSFTVRKQGDALLVSGSGLQASARLVAGRWPPPGKSEDLARLEDRGLALLEPIVQAQPDALRKAFVSDDAAIAGKQVVDGLRPRLSSSPGLSYVGTESAAPRASWFRLKAKDGALYLRVVWSADGRFQALSEGKEPLSFRAEFRVLRRDVAAAAIGGTTVSLTVEGEGASRVLVYEDGSAGDAGLLECRWTGDAR